MLAGIITFAVIRLRSNPHREGRESRFAGSHTGAAWLVLLGIFLVIATLLIYRGAQINTGDFPYPHGAFASQLVGHWLAPLGTGANSVIETVFILAQLAVILGFGVFVTYSKHLHIITAPLNVLFSRRPNALRALEPMRCNGTGAGLRGGRPGHRRVRAGQDRGLLLEGPAGHGHLHRVRAVPVAVPGLGHRQAAVAQAWSSSTCATTPWPRPPTCWPAATRPGRQLPEAVKAEAARPLVGDEAGARRDRPRRALVLHQLRGLRGGVPGGHRAHRPHRRDAPAPGADRVGLPGRGGRAC